MLMHKSDFFSICFGKAQTYISLEDMRAHRLTENVEKIAKNLDVDKFAFLRQTHSVSGMNVSKLDLKNSHCSLFEQEGDFLITQKKQYGIGVVSADCLPIVLYDPVHHAVGIAHSGWKGSFNGIAKAVIDLMKDEFQSPAEELQVYLGPSARGCCYEVQHSFYESFLKVYDGVDDAFVKKNGKIYFDNGLFTILVLRSLGIKPENIYTKYNVCTICDESFCSYRREKEKSNRQMTIIALN